MQVAKLIDELKKLPPDALLVVRGYEYGVNSVSHISETKVILDRNADGPWWSGRHYNFSFFDDEPGATTVYEIVGTREKEVDNA
jgi:hypothetical protein